MLSQFLIIITSFLSQLTQEINPPPISPLSTSNQVVITSNPAPKKILSFVPYWNLKPNLELQPQYSTDLAYFSYTINPDGSLVKDIGASRSHSPLIQDLRLKHPHLSFHLVFSLFSLESLTSLLTSPAAQDQAIASIISVLQTHQATGINIDFEPNQSAPHLAPYLTQFLHKLNQAANKLPQPPTLSLDIYANPSKNGFWDINSLSSLVDYFIVMTYDYHRPNSPTTGPIAPLMGKQHLNLNNDIMSNLRQLVKIIPSRQILLGIPFYGYEWQTTSNQPLAHTFPHTGVMASYQRVKSLLDKVPSPELYWNPHSFTPWLVFLEGNTIKQIHFDNPASISHKIDLVNQADLAGVAIWALGYEGDHEDIWQPFITKLNPQDSTLRP